MMQKIDEVVLVDEQDQELGACEKLQAHREGLLHRAFSVFIFCEFEGEKKWLLQQRQLDKYHCGGLWTNTCCSHPRQDESVLAAGERRLMEEMGFTVPLLEVGSFHYIAHFDNGLTENELDHVLVGEGSQESFVVNQEEVADFKWLSAVEIQQQLQETPEQFTPWFAEAFGIVLNACSVV